MMQVSILPLRKQSKFYENIPVWAPHTHFHQITAAFQLG